LEVHTFGILNAIAHAVIGAAEHRVACSALSGKLRDRCIFNRFTR
jgi:hypothetical protein